ncbi:MAG: proton-conducting transporter membrane subunit [Desulfobacteraceae bacterium]
MNAQYPALLIVAPLLSALLISICGWVNKRLCFPIAVAALSVAAYSATGLLVQVLTENAGAGGEEAAVLYRIGGWDPPWGIGYYVDSLNALVLMVISVVALLNLLATHRAVQEAFPAKTGAFYTLYVLMITGLLGITVTGDAFNLYVLLEITALTGYGLIAMGEDRAPLASLNYVYMGTMGACFYLLGIGYLYIITGSLNMMDMASILPDLYDSRVVIGAFVICMVGLWLKMAFFPLHAWLPNAYTFAPSPVTSVVAPLVTKVMIYVMIRLMVTVFTPEFTFSVAGLSTSVVWLAVIAIVMGSILALGAPDVKKMLTYVIIAEVGYMVGGAWLGNRAGMTGSILHIANDALMTLCVFLALGNVVYRVKGYQFDDFRSMFKKMPFTMMGLTTGALSMIGVPPLCGFFSKWYLISGGVQAGQYGFVAALVFSSLINAVLFFRVFERAYYGRGEPNHGHHAPAVPMAEAPVGMVVPLLMVAGGLIGVGIYTGDIVAHIIDPFIPAGLAG